MSRRRRLLLKGLIKKFKWAFLGLILLTFLASYLSFLIRFNLRTNLYFWEHRGKFYYLFGKLSVIEKVEGDKIFINWNKLLIILFLLYFPLKIIIQFTLRYFQKYYERKAKVYLTKKLLSFAFKNKSLVNQKSSEKVYIINHAVPKFSRQFFTVPIDLFGTFATLSLEIFSLLFLIRTRNLSALVTLIITFLAVNLLWLILFNLFTGRIRKSEKKKRWDYQKEEEVKARIFLENLNSDSRPTNLNEIHTLLDKNSGKIYSSTFLSVLTELPNFIIPGITILFLYLYYKIWGSGSLNWNEYFVAYNLQRILSESKKIIHYSKQISNFRESYWKILSFYE